MRKFLIVVLYLLWIVTIGLVVTAILTDFKYEDINLLALLFTTFSLINSFFSVTKK